MTIPIASINASTLPAVADAISTVSVLAGETMHVYMLIFQDFIVTQYTWGFCCDYYS